RYHVPRTGQEGRFTSQAITLDLSNLARLADPSNVRPPVREHGVGGGRTTVAGPLDGPKSLDTIKPICAFWTEYPAFIHRLNKKEYENMKKARAGIEVSMQLLVDDLEVGEPLLDGGGSPINGVSIKQGQSFKYRLKIAMTEHSGMPLLATPVIDDVTIMYTTGVEYIYYSRLDPES
ncbi:MAG TPA: hypothetical protein VJU16_00400, partial [Planctomycetota bacterium]|nr:hypothetical protein [Planctomycetota bacterium]